MNRLTPLALAFFGIAAFAAAASGDPVEIELGSPNGAVSIGFSALPAGALTYRISFRNRAVVTPSALGYEFDGQPPLEGHLRLVSSQRDEIDETYSMPTGKTNPVHNHCRTLRLDLEEVGAPNRRLVLEARAFDDGVAFRYVIPAQPAFNEVRISRECTAFDLAKEGTVYPLLLQNFHTPYEDDHHTLPLTGIHGDDLIGLPLLAEIPDVAWVAITEADIENYPGLYLAHTLEKQHPRLLSARLAPSMNEPGLAVDAATPIVSPWRVVMVAEEPGRLVESNIVCNLNPPSAIGDTSWIKPGKTAWEWWSGHYADGVTFTPGMNTATMKHYVDFAASSGFPYMLIDAGWAYPGTGPNFSGCDLTRWNPAVDLASIVAYARQRNVGIWLWANWIDIHRQADACLPLFAKWGIAGIKIDFMERDDQWMTNFYRRTVRQAAENHLMIDYHGAFKPDGIRRTWPNLVTREAVMGAEYNKWSARVTPEHNVMLAFTRMLAGPMDYTPGGFDNVTRGQFIPRWVRPEVMTTRAHALALYVVFESALQMVSDYPEAYHNQLGFAFIRAVPTVWDETRVLGGRPEDYVAIARRKGREWFVGAITGREGRTINLTLGFLGPGSYAADIYSDAPDSAQFPKHSVTQVCSVNALTNLPVMMAPGGGEAIFIHSAR